MSRSGYTEDSDDDLAFGRWRGIVASAIRGKRGQKLLVDLAQALDEMTVKELISESLKTDDGSFCTLGVLGEKRGINLKEIDPEDSSEVADQFDIAEALAKEIVYLNDEACSQNTPGERWLYMRSWVTKHTRVKSV